VYAGLSNVHQCV